MCVCTYRAVGTIGRAPILAIIPSISRKARAAVAGITRQSACDGAGASILTGLHPTNAVGVVAVGAIVASTTDGLAIGVAEVGGGEVVAVWLVAHRAVRGRQEISQ